MILDCSRVTNCGIAAKDVPSVKELEKNWRKDCALRYILYVIKY